MNIAENIEKTANSLSSIVPQIFFDLIARIIPGPIILGSFLIVLNDHSTEIDKMINSIKPYIPTTAFYRFCLLMLVFYIISIIFFGIWNFCILILNTIIIKAINKIIRAVFRKKSMQLPKLFIEGGDYGADYSHRHDIIKLQAPVAGNRITKLKAEIHMASSLFINFFICLVLSMSKSRYYFFSFLFLMIGALFSNYHYHDRLKKSVYSYSALLKYRKDDFPFVVELKKKRHKN
jgi:hypothetical protein